MLSQMPDWSLLLYIFTFTIIGSVLSLIGGVILLFREGLANKTSHFLAAFAAGALLGTAFFDLLPEAAEEAGETTNFFLWTLIGILIFFILERGLHWFHHHGREHPAGEGAPTVPLIILGDSVHNFIDGIVIAATFLVSVPLGIVTSLAVAAHEIPQEIGDFGVLLHKGLARKKVLIFNLLSALAAILGALLTFFLSEQIEGLLAHFLALTAGFFIYIAASDLIPEIHHKNERGFAVAETILLVLGVVVVWFFVTYFEGFVAH